MISFRFHLISIAAVFLGIAIGVVVGSTFVDRAVVDSLEDRIDTVSGNLDDLLDENAELQGENGRIEDFIEASSAFAVTDRLAGTSVLVVATRGVDDGAVRRFVELARQAGAVVPGIVWLEPRWALADGDQADDLAALLDVTPGSPDRVRNRAWNAALDELAASEEPTVPDDGEAPTEPTEPTVPTGPTEPLDTTTITPTTATVPAVPSTPVLTALTDSGFMSFERVGDDGGELALLGGTGPAIVAVTGPAAERELQPLVEPIVTAADDTGLSVLVAETYVDLSDDETDGPERGATATAVVPEDRTAAISIVDHLERPDGVVAAVLAVADLHADVVGHYGYGPRAASPLPAWAP